MNNRKEIEYLKKKRYKIISIEDLKRNHPKAIFGNGIVILSAIILIVDSGEEKHDSGYPFIKVFGAVEGYKKLLIDLGQYHDHIMLDVKRMLNIDALGPNIIRISRSIGFFRLDLNSSFTISTNSLIITHYGIIQ